MLPSLVNAVPIPAILIDGDARVSLVNSEANKLFGDRIAGRHYVSVLRQPAVLDAVETAMRVGTPAEAIYISAEATRETIWRARAAPVKLPETAGVLLTLEDRTAEREADQMRRDFVGNVSHELRTPLTAMLGFIETLKGAARNDPDARERFLDIMEREAERMNRLVRDLLSLSRVEGQERLRPVDTVDLGGLVKSVVSSLAPLAEEAGVSVSVLSNGETHTVIGDSDQLQQVFTNLFENAIKYGGAGERVVVEIDRLRKDPRMPGEFVVVRVQDFGEGIDPLHLPRLTERFYRIDSHRSREMGGTGLGLAIVKHIVNRHRGHLRIESDLGEGSTFTVAIPAKEPEPRSD